ncbi:hypothetical protein [Pectinatus sottacetonis]|uniref:hypothetical protein n=1 Tax=Pectinatus sottacetonis TaxID=1002795 RepID=UPI0018C78599|nr:hypothetical protein [Pectinatus sottacetonis]
MAIEVEKISCVNSAAFVMEFKVKYADEDGNELNADWSSGKYPVGQSRTCDLAELSHPIPEGAPIWIQVHAILGKTKTSNTHKFFYKKNKQSASFKVTGTTLNFSIHEL